MIENLTDADYYRAVVLQSQHREEDEGPITDPKEVAKVLGMSERKAYDFLRRIGGVGYIPCPINKPTIRALHRQVKLKGSTRHAYMGKFLRMVKDGDTGEVLNIDTKTRRFLETVYFAYQPLVKSLGVRKGCVVNPSIFANPRTLSKEDTTFWNAEAFANAPEVDGYSYDLRGIRVRNGFRMVQKLPDVRVYDDPMHGPHLWMLEGEEVFKDTDKGGETVQSGEDAALLSGWIADDLKRSKRAFRRIHGKPPTQTTWKPEYPDPLVEYMEAQAWLMARRKLAGPPALYPTPKQSPHVPASGGPTFIGNWTEEEKRGRESALLDQLNANEAPALAG